MTQNLYYSVGISGDFSAKIPCRSVLCRVIELVAEFSSAEYMTDTQSSRLTWIPESCTSRMVTILYSNRIAVDLILRVLACLAESLGIRATTFRVISTFHRI